MFTKNTLLAILGCCLLAVPATAATIHGPSPYLSLEDRPDDIFDPDAMIHIEDFENPDGPWEECFSIDRGSRIALEFGIDQDEELTTLAENAAFNEIRIVRDLCGVNRFLFAVKA